MQKQEEQASVYFKRVRPSISEDLKEKWLAMDMAEIDHLYPDAAGKRAFLKITTKKRRVGKKHGVSLSI